MSDTPRSASSLQQVCGTEIAPSQVRQLEDGREEAGFWLSLPPKGAAQQASSQVAGQRAGNRVALFATPLKLPMLAAFRFGVMIDARGSAVGCRMR